MAVVTQRVNCSGHLPRRGRYWLGWENRVRVARRRLAEDTDTKAPLVEVDFKVFNPRDYLLSHATIVGGVEPTKDHGYIVTPHGKWVNDNGNAWFNRVVLESYTTFLLAYNFQEHIQIPEFAKGFIIDAVAWIVKDRVPGEAEKIPTVFVDILVATNRKRHPDLVDDIERGRIKTLSMGTEISHFQCSRCLKIFREDNDSPCRHLREQVGEWFRGEDGKQHRVAELCGVPGRRGSNIWVEASFVGVPAFEEAERHGGLEVGKESSGRPLKGRVPRERWREAQVQLKRWKREF